MKRAWLSKIAGAALLATSTLASAHGNVNFGVYFGAPAPVYAAPIYSPPVYAPRAYYAPPPVYSPAPVYYGPAYGAVHARSHYGPPHRGWHRDNRRHRH